MTGEPETELDALRYKGPPAKLYKVGDVMKATGLSRQTIHNYTLLGFIHAVERTDTGHRLYGEETFKRLHRVKLYRVHHTMEEIKVKMDEEFGPGPSAANDTSKSTEDE